jgi:hypothetical protein
MDKQYEVINFRYTDPANSIFKSGKSDRAQYWVYRCCNKDNCAAYRSGKCFMHNGLWGQRCPYGNTISETGFTPRAAGYGKFLGDAKEKYRDYAYKLSDVKFPCIIGDYVHIGLPHLKNYVNPIKEELIGESLIKRDNFTPEFVLYLIRYRPQALMGGEITSYQREEIPRFISQLKKHMPEVYAKVVALDPSVADRIANINYKGKYALVKTLLPSKVKLSTNILDWDGKQLKAKGRDISFWRLDNEEVIITPNDETYVEIVNNDSVDENTVFRE